MARKSPAARAAPMADPLGDFRHENLGRLLIESFRHFRERTLVNLRAHGFKDLNPVHAAMLRRVDEGGNHVSDIAMRMGVTKQAAAQLVARVEKLGYVSCQSDPADSRKKTVRCTARGRRFLESREGVVADSVQDVASIIGAERLHELEETLQLIVSGARGPVEVGQPQRIGDARGSGTVASAKRRGVPQIVRRRRNASGKGK